MVDGVEFFICKPNNTLSVEHVLFIRFLKICNRPKLFMMTGRRNGLYFLLRLGRLSYTSGFQSETLMWSQLFSVAHMLMNCFKLF